MSGKFFDYTKMANFPVVVFDNESNLEYANELATRELKKSKLVLEENKTHKIDDIPIIFNNVENCVRLKADNKKIYICLSSKLVENNKKFMANFSHEIRTPLNAIIGTMSLMADTELTKDQKIYTEMINEASVNLLRLVNDILDHTRLDTGRLNINKKEMSIRECISSAIKVVGYKASNKKIEIKASVDYDVEDIVISDQARIRQILVNLYYNSIKFSPDNSCINTRVTYNKDGFILFSVSDFGIGVSKEKEDDLFVSFSKINTEYDSVDQEGLGLGLSISKDLVKLLGGDIWFNSEYKKGAEFIFSIPFEIKKNKTIADNTQKVFSHVQVILIHSDIRERVNISKQIMNNGINCHAVSSIDEAQDIIEDTCQNLLIIDTACLEKPKNCVLIKARKKLEIISKTAILIALVNPNDLYQEIDSENRDNYWISLFDHVINKPFEISKLVKIIEGFVADISNNYSKLQESELEKYNHEKAVKARYSNIKILVDEDVYLNRIIIKKLLEKLGCDNITMVENGLDAYQKILSGEEYDICIIDIKTPKMSGIELVKKIRELKIPPGKKWYCVAVTANTESEDFFTGNKFDDFIIKPVSVEILKEKLNNYLFKKNIIKSI